MQYLCTFIRTFRTVDEDGRKRVHQTREHIACRDLAEAQRLSETVNDKFGFDGELRCDVSLKVWRPEGGSIVMNVDDWFRICEQITDSGKSTGKPSFAA